MPSLHVQPVLDDEVSEIVNSSTDQAAILPTTVNDDADSCGSVVAMTSGDDTESSSQEVYAVHSLQDDLSIYFLKYLV